MTFFTLAKFFASFCFFNKAYFSLTEVEIRICVFPFLAELLDFRGCAFGILYTSLGETYTVDDGEEKCFGEVVFSALLKVASSTEEPACMV